MRLYYLLLPLLFSCHTSAPIAAHQTSAPSAVSDGMVAVGGLSLHIHCVGQGAPAVVLDAGLGNDGSVWKGVQLEVGRSTRACAYDRAGMGYSSPAPTPHSNRQMARELHQLLTRSGMVGPYVLVGHSMGGINVRLFEAEHPDEVAGVVLVDATVDPERSRSLVPAEEMKKFQEMLPKIGEGLDFETFVAGAADMRASSKSLGAKPLVVLTRSLQDPEPWASPEQLSEMLRIWQEMQADLPKLSSNSVQIVVPQSHHYIQLEAPQIVVEAIAEVVQAVRKQGRLNGAALASKASAVRASAGN